MTNTDQLREQILKIAIIPPDAIDAPLQLFDVSNLATFIEQHTATAVRAARIDEANLRLDNARHLLNRAHKWQLTEAGRRDMITGECLMPAQDRVKQLRNK